METNPDLQQKILNIIQLNCDHGAVVKLDETMYAYGDSDTFEIIMSEVWDDFGVILYDRNYEKDIGDLKVSEFIDRTIELIKEHQANGKPEKA